MQKRGPAAGSDADLEPLVALFRLLSDKTRLSILMLLARGERNVTSLCDELRLPQPTVSHHLGLLRMSNLITNRRDGKQVFYELDGRVDASGPKTLQVSIDRYKVSLTFPQSTTPSAATGSKSACVGLNLRINGDCKRTASGPPRAPTRNG